MSPDYRHIHLIALGGSGMAGLASMLKSAGYHVSGSDAHVYPPMSHVLEREGIPYKEGFRPENLDRNTDLVIIGNTVSKTNPEVQETLRRNLDYMSLPQALEAFFLCNRFPVVIAGTHGKTTTAALAAWVLDQAGLDPGFLIGGWANNFSGNSRVGSGKYFVVEGDEYDTAFFDKGPKFLHYRPQAAILTSIEFDHADIYSDLAQVKKAFSSFVKQIPTTGLLIAAEGNSHIRDVITDASCRMETYGIHSNSVWRVTEPIFSDQRVRFRVFHGSQDMGEFLSRLSGRHNLLNALAVIALAAAQGIPLDVIRSAVASFQGVRRRQEVLGIVKGVMVIDDFAHHPTAIYETLLALRMQYPEKRLWAVFEPRSATSRRRVFQEHFPKAFREADRVVISDLYSPDKIPADQRLDPRQVVADLVADGIQAVFCATVDHVLKYLTHELRSGDVVCVMSSGDFGGLHTRLLSALSGKNRRTVVPSIKA
jgi:UDP-N-acetylmuramate: L-alanyl-gamma-D-glutamyl-meso-diaminopimelate ligase